MIHRIRGVVLPGVAGTTLLLLAIGLFGDAWFLLPAALGGALTALGLRDLSQTEHSVLRNYPILGHLRFLLEDIGPEAHPYFVESNTSGRPFSRDQRSLIYARAGDVSDRKAFGTELDVYSDGYAWIAPSLDPRTPVENPTEAFRVLVGEGRCAQPYAASIFNISGMSFGALGANAILALNRGARRGGFAHDTGEGGLSRYHREPGGDLIWQIGTGYFGCRNAQGGFDAELFAHHADIDSVKMIEVKISQGAKPGHGGILPARKITEEIAAARRITPGRDCISPPGHSAFDSPVGLLEFVTRLRELSGGKPVGFKLCVGDPREVFAICKAMVDTGLRPDFITVDGGEGGTGAAPIEFSDHLGAPLRDGLILVHNALVGIGVRNEIKLAASGKRSSGFDIAAAIAMGADWCNSARGFMFATGCIQSQRCHTNECPVGVATQDPHLQRALDVEDKAERVYRFHRNTVTALAEIIAAAGLEHPSDLGPELLWWRLSLTDVRSLDRLYQFFEPGQLLDGRIPESLRHSWEAASGARW